jgi:STAS domain
VSGFDLAEMPGYVARLVAAPGPPLWQLELDLSNETSLDPAGLAFVMRARAAVQGTRGELRLQGLQPGVRDQLAAIGIPELTKPLSDPRASAGPATPAGCTLPGSTLPRP